MYVYTYIHMTIYISTQFHINLCMNSHIFNPLVYVHLDPCICTATSIPTEYAQGPFALTSTWLHEHVLPHVHQHPQHLHQHLQLRLCSHFQLGGHMHVPVCLHLGIDLPQHVHLPLHVHASVQLHLHHLWIHIYTYRKVFKSV